jgi:hypothetical protein
MLGTIADADWRLVIGNPRRGNSLFNHADHRNSIMASDALRGFLPYQSTITSYLS